ncbi:hypothetical protein C2845_PM12G01750 [Panicum miliaceum]|uniref:F-box associated beta-propeller type 3 domain-containing protein n=1 Tax=Panicum miliaceum TaxID=4540 RepID=A0A3L6QH77_PANMI|nr:hypothetical protein C2845_PM12G01750 [Panicum miliaceum]
MGRPAVADATAVRQRPGVRVLFPPAVRRAPPAVHWESPGAVIRIPCAVPRRRRGTRPQVLLHPFHRRLGPVAEGGSNPFTSACVAIRGTLYWSRHPEAGGSGDVVAFDTVSEAFRLIPSPPLAGHHLRTFEMDGRLAVSAAEAHSRRMDVWALEDGGGGEKWACLLRVDLPVPRRRAG